MSNRPQRIAELVHAELSKMLRTELKDPGVGMVSITHVDVTRDLRQARVHVTPLGGLGDGKQMLKGLKAATGFLRRLLGQRMRLRHTPEIEFVLDDGIGEAVRMTSMLSQMEEDRRQREAPEAGEE